MAESSCIFCQIIAKVVPSTIVFEDNEIIIFNDIKPAAKSHYLIVPKTHITNAKNLQIEHFDLVTSLVEQAEKILEKDGFNKECWRLGFHWPPFCSVPHLHLHAIAPESSMGFLARIIFRLNSYWFVTPEYVLQRIKESALKITSQL